MFIVVAFAPASPHKSIHRPPAPSPSVLPASGAKVVAIAVRKEHSGAASHRLIRERKSAAVRHKKVLNRNIIAPRAMQTR